MVYFLGRDVNVYLFTECQVVSGSIGSLANEVCVGSLEEENRTFADSMTATTLSSFTAQADITGVDVSIGATDEDITYIGQDVPAKVEIKKEYTISLTRKKSNNLWDLIFNGPVTADNATDNVGKHGARWGFGDDAVEIGGGNYNPATIRDSVDNALSAYGYRIAVQLASGASTDGTDEVMCFPNCVINGHTVSLNADGITEETLEFSTVQDMLYGVDGVNIDKTLTTRTAM